MLPIHLVRTLKFMISAYLILVGIQQLLVINLTNHYSWYTSFLHQYVANAILAASILIGTFLMYATHVHRRKYVLHALGLTLSFQITLAVLNALMTNAQGALWVPAIFMGVVSAVLWSFIKVAPDEFFNLKKEKEKKNDSIFKGSTKTN